MFITAFNVECNESLLLEIKQP